MDGINDLPGTSTLLAIIVIKLIINIISSRNCSIAESRMRNFLKNDTTLQTNNEKLAKSIHMIKKS